MISKPGWRFPSLEVPEVRLPGAGVGGFIWRHGRGLAIFAVLLLAYVEGVGFLSFLKSPERQQLALLVVGIILFIGLTATRIEYGVLLLPPTAVAVPFSFGTGTGSPLVAALLLTAFLMGLWVLRMALGHQLVVKRSPVTLPLIGFLIVAVLSTVNSNVMRDPMIEVWASFPLVQTGGVGVFIISAGLLLLVVNSFTSIGWLKWLVVVFLGTAVAAVLRVSLPGGGGLPPMESGGLFSMWVVVIAGGQALFNTRLTWWQRVGIGLIAAVWFGRRFGIENFWLSGWVPSAVALMALCWFKSRRAFFACVLVGLVVAAFSFQKIFEEEVTGDEAYGNSVRLEIWKRNIELAWEHPLLGVGIAGYAPYYMTYATDRAMSSHSNYLDIFSQTGLVGSFFFVWFWIALFRLGDRIRKRWSGDFGAALANSVLAGMAGVTIAMAMGDWLIPFVYNQTIAGYRYTMHSWLFFGALASMEHMVPSAEKQ